MKYIMKYIKITKPDINNGTGCRVTLWIPGCSHNCPGCHNAWTTNYNIGKKFDDDAKQLISNELSKSYISGITISGGDPLDQSEEFLKELEEYLTEIRNKFPDKNIWIYTGYYYKDLNEAQLRVVRLCDKLVDGPFIKSLADPSLPFRGSSNQSIIDINSIMSK